MISDSGRDVAGASQSASDRPQEDMFPLSYAQQRLWFLDQLDTQGNTYVLAVLTRLKGASYPHAVEAAIGLLVQRHEVLRTSFRIIDGTPKQVIDHRRRTILEHRSLVDLVKKVPLESALSAAVQEELDQPFNLSTGPVFRATYFDCGSLESAILLSMHHIVADGWSLAILQREFGEFLAAFVTGREVQLPELPIQYADFAVWQRSQDDSQAEALSWWLKQLDGSPAAIALRTDHPKPAIRSFDGRSQVFTVSPQVLKGLRSLAASERATIFMVLLAAFNSLLFRYTDQPDLVVGVPASGRTRPETEHLIGFFVNMLPLRLRLAGDPTFAELVRQAREVVSRALSNQDVPFERIVEQLGIARSLSSFPLFEVTLSYQGSGHTYVGGTPAQERNLGPDLHYSSLPFEPEAARFDLDMAIFEASEELLCSITYATELFDEATVSGMVRHFLRLLEVVSVDPERRLSELDLMSEEEWSKVVVEWNDSSVEFPVDRSVVDLFEEQVDRSPGAVAVACDGEELSYSELNERANRLAHRLIELGVGPEVLVGVCLSRSVEMLVSVLAVLKAGGAYVPLDPDYPAERLAFMVSDASPHVVLTQLRHERLLAGATSVVCVDGTDVVAGWAVSNPERAVDPENLAYVIYTSGSTGRPKGVAGTNLGAMKYVSWITDRFEIDSDDVVAQLSPLGADISLWEIMAPLIRGGRVLLPTRGPAEDPAYVGELLASCGVTIMHLVPSLLRPILPFLSETRGQSNLKAILCSGEPLTASEVLACHEKFPDISILNIYGVTECAIDSTECVANPFSEASTVPAGRPIANTQIYVLDRFFEPVPVGVVGEIFIGGLGVARGYWRRPGLTAERFVPDPFGELGGRLYRTGDLGYWCADGSLQFLGRIDHQVKIRGHRVECGEVESVLAEIPGVVEVAVLATGDPPDSRLVAYLSWEFEPMSVSQLWEAARRHLPDYMIPSSFVAVDSLPLLPNGKLDRNALPPADAQPHIDAQYVAPRTSTEAELARIWADVLGIDSVGVYDNYFDLGGDSILSIRVTSEARASGIWISPVLVFEHQTISELAEFVEDVPAGAAEQGAIVGRVPLGPVQSMFFATDSEFVDDYDLTLSLSSEPKLDVNSLRIALRSVVAQHDMLRARYWSNLGEWIQDLAAPDAVSDGIEVVRVGAENPSGRHGPSTTTRGLSPYTLTHTPRLRCTWYDAGDEPGKLVFTCHHLAIDALSWAVVVEDFARVYCQHVARRPLVMRPKSTSYHEWSTALTQSFVYDELEDEREFWLAQLRAKDWHLPVDYPAGDTSHGSTDIVRDSIGREATSALVSGLPRNHQAVIQDALLAALVRTISEWSGHLSTTIDVETHGRHEFSSGIDLSRTVGWFTTYFPISVELTAGGDEADDLEVVRRKMQQVPNAGVGYGLLFGRTDVNGASIGGRARGGISLNYLGRPTTTIASSSPFLRTDIEDQLSSLSADPRRQRAHLLEIDAVVANQQLVLQWTYSSSVHYKTTIERLVRRMVQHLEEFAARYLSSRATPVASDYPSARLSQSQLDAIVERLGTSQSTPPALDDGRR